MSRTIRDQRIMPSVCHSWRGFLRSFVLAATAAIGSDVAHAEVANLSNDAIKVTFAGATVHLDTPAGIVLPVTYGEDGSLVGKAGGLAIYLGSASDRGRWWVASGRLCHKWSTWFDAATNCMQVRREGSKLLWHRDDGQTGTASIVSKPAVVVAAAPHPVPFGLGGPAVPSPAPSAGSPTVVLQKGPAPSAVGNAIKKVVLAPPVVPRAAPSVVTFRVTNVHAADVLNIRSGPSAGAPLVGTIPPGSRRVHMVGPCQREWCLVGYEKITGWVNRIFLELDAPPSAVRGKPSST